MAAFNLGGAMNPTPNTGTKSPVGVRINLVTLALFSTPSGTPVALTGTPFNPGIQT